MRARSAAVTLLVALLLGAATVPARALEAAPRTRPSARTGKRQPAARAPRPSPPTTLRRASRLLDPLIGERYSARAYKRSRVARDKIASVLLAAQSASSAFGMRPWRFI